MDLIILRLFLLFCLSIIPLPTFAGDFDGSKPLSGSVNKIIEINPSKIINDVDPETVGLPRKFLIDFEEKLLRPFKG